jgi:organic hydroperoxide reductase OsmC/OhrA
MAISTAGISWSRGDQAFVDNRYSRAHIWRFDSGIELAASSSPSVVPLPYSNAQAVDPEEAFVASLSSCHMLWFLSLAAGAGWVVDSYEDQADGVLAKNAVGKLAMTVVTLRPRVSFAGDRLPSEAEVESLHHRAHAECFLASSVTTEIRCEPCKVSPA